MNRYSAHASRLHEVILPNGFTLTRLNFCLEVISSNSSWRTVRMKVRNLTWVVKGRSDVPLKPWRLI